MNRRVHTLFGCACTILLMASLTSAEILLYDGSAGAIPSAQGWTYATDPLFGPSATQVSIGSAVRLDTTPAMTDAAGYFSTGHPTLPNMDQLAGFTLRFDVRVNSESHVSTNRAGFSVIAVSSDLGAIEIGMWTNEIWAQSDTPLFTHAESTSFDTSSATNRYDLTLYHGHYILEANGVEILTGPVRDYTAFSGVIDPYEFPSFVFLGDDTSSASAEIDLSYVSMTLLPFMNNFVISNDMVMITLSNLEGGVTFDIERNIDLTSTNWNLVETISPTGSSMNWGTSASGSDPSLLRIRGTGAAQPGSTPSATK